MELKDALLKTFAKAMQTPNEKETTLYYATVKEVQIDGNGKKKIFVSLDGSDPSILTPVVEGTQAMVDDRVLVTIENHKAVIMNNVSSPASARTATSYMDFITEGSTSGLVIGDISDSSSSNFNILIKSTGIDIRDGQRVLSDYTSSSINFYTPGTGTLASRLAASLGSNGLNVKKGVIGKWTITQDGSLYVTDTTDHYQEMSWSFEMYIHAADISYSYYVTKDEDGNTVPRNYFYGSTALNLDRLHLSTGGTASSNDYATLQAGILTLGDSNGNVNIDSSHINLSNSSGGAVHVVTGSYNVALHANTAGNRGIYDSTSSTWLIYRNVNNTTRIPADLFLDNGALHLGTGYGTNLHVSCVWSDNGWHDIITRNGSSNDVFIGGSKDISGITTRTFIRGDTIKLNDASGASISSDRNIKKDIATYDSKYDDFYDALNPVTYKFINGKSGRTHSGFISQDVRDALLSSGLSTEDFGGYIKDELTYRETDTDGSDFETSDVNYLLDHGINEIHQLIYQEFIALNTWQIQKLKKRLAELEERLNG